MLLLQMWSTPWFFFKSAMITNHQTVRGHRELKKQLQTDSSQCKRDEGNSKLAKKHPPKKPCTAYVTFSKEMWKTVVKDNPTCSMREVNSKISELWNTLSEEERQRYQIKAQETFAQSVNSYNSIQCSLRWFFLNSFWGQI